MDKLNTSSSSWLSDLMLDEMEMDGCDLFQQNLFDDEDLFSYDIGSVLQQQQQQQQPLSPVSSHSSTTSHILSFQNTTTTTTTHFHAFDCALNTKQNEVVTEVPQNENVVVKRCLGHNSDKYHIIAERKRREKLNKGLIALAALIPGLKKMDKASVVGEAIKYLKELQERLKVLEQHNKNSLVVESVVMDNKPKVIHGSWSNDGSESLSHVDARVLNKDVLIRILCQKQKGLLFKLLDEIEKLHLFVVTSNVLPFGDSINITIVAKMEMGYNLTLNDLIKHLRVAAFKLS
ncbi:unnamed protein product [Vicia faba]|uniref:BHLH domain-containing protein n=1 Tax=Vicia faba TaxID=3906 RepID=A0AAV0YCK1_VICFA|nr:unnamed protein product [Vicia faba]